MNKYFLEPEIKVTKFDVCDVITTSGYEQETKTDIADGMFNSLSNNKVVGGLDGDIPL